MKNQFNFVFIFIDNWGSSNARRATRGQYANKGLREPNIQILWAEGVNILISWRVKREFFFLLQLKLTQICVTLI